MTVISAVITQHGTAHASDSLLTTLKADGTYKIVEGQEPKLVYVKYWRGAFAFWGLARFGKSSTLDWLRVQTQRANKFASSEEFANTIAANLNQEFGRLSFRKPLDKGIGIHFTAYERISDYWIPELFLISNWTDPSYTDIRPTGVGASRETYHTLKNIPSAPEHRDPQFRLEVHEALQSGKMFRYNNGDPTLFNPAANAIFDAFFTLMNRGTLNAPNDKKTHCALCRRPIGFISDVLGDLSKKGTRLIGGKLHDICISPDGTCWSSSGDCV